MATVAAVNVNDITKITSGIILGLLVIGGLLFFLLSKLLIRLVIVIVVVGLGIALWLQRDHVTDEISIHKCNFDATFFGFHLQPSKTVEKACAGRLH